jgi:hypothetical protein
VVFIEGAVEDVPPALVAQMRGPRARLVTVRAGAGRVGQAVLGELSEGGLALRADFDCATTLLPPLRRAAGFVF